jgi:hypothetical protein
MVVSGKPGGLALTVQLPTLAVRQRHDVDRSALTAVGAAEVVGRDAKEVGGVVDGRASWEGCETVVGGVDRPLFAACPIPNRYSGTNPVVIGFLAFPNRYSVFLCTGCESVRSPYFIAFVPLYRFGKGFGGIGG